MKVMAVVVWTAYAFQVYGCSDRHEFSNHSTEQDCKNELAKVEGNAGRWKDGHVFVCAQRALP